MNETQEVAPEQGALTELAPVTNQAEATNPQVTAADGEEGQQEQEQQPAKTFSQEEVEAIVAKRLAREARKSERAMAVKLAEVQSQRTAPEPKREDFATDEAHERARIDHEIERRALAHAERISAQREQETKQRSAATAFWERADEASERFPDLPQVINDPTLPMSQHMADFVMSSDIGPELAYHLAKNRGKAAAIAQMGPIQAARELMTLESEFKARPKAQSSKAPEPIVPIGARGRATATANPSDDDDIDTWMRKERQRVQKLR